MNNSNVAFVLFLFTTPTSNNYAGIVFRYSYTHAIISDLSVYCLRHFYIFFGFMNFVKVRRPRRHRYWCNCYAYKIEIPQDWPRNFIENIIEILQRVLQFSKKYLVVLSSSGLVVRYTYIYTSTANICLQTIRYGRPGLQLPFENTQYQHNLIVESWWIFLKILDTVSYIRTYISEGKQQFVYLIWSKSRKTVHFLILIYTYNSIFPSGSWIRLNPHLI